MAKNKNITPLQVYMTLYLSVSLTLHVMIAPFLLQAVRRDAWISAILAAVPLTIWILLLMYLVQKLNRTSIQTWLQMHYGKTVRWTITAVAWGYFFVSAFSSLFNTVTWVQVSYLPATPLQVSIVIILALCGIAAAAGIRAIAISAGLLLPFLIVLDFFVKGANVQLKNFQLLLPMLEHGWRPVISGIGYACAGIFEAIVLLFVQDHLSSNMKTGGLLIMNGLFIATLTSTLIESISLFGPFEAAELRFPVYEQWRIVKLGKHLSNSDFLSIYQWLSSAFIRISFSLFVLVDLLNMKQVKYRRWTLFIIVVGLFSLFQFQQNDILFLAWVKQFYFPISFYVVIILTLLFACLVYLKTRRRYIVNETS